MAQPAPNCIGRHWYTLAYIIMSFPDITVMWFWCMIKGIFFVFVCVQRSPELCECAYEWW